MLFAVVAKIIEDNGCVRVDFLAFFFLAVENTQGVFVKPFPARFAHIVDMVFVIFFQRFVVFLSARRTAYAVDIERKVVKTEPCEQRFCNRNRLDVHFRAVTAVKLHAELVMFAKSARLRTFVSENGRDIISLHGKRPRVQTVFDKTSRNARRAFRFQRDRAVAFVEKGVHFLIDDVRRIAHAAQEQFGMFKSRRADFFDVEKARRFTDGVFDIMPFVTVLGEDVFRTLRDIETHIAS